MVSHDLDALARVCQRILLLSEGHLIAQGAPQEVFRPDLLEAAFGVPVSVWQAPDGAPSMQAHFGSLDLSRS